MGSLCLCLFLAAGDAYGQTRTWLGAGADGNWGTAGNWSTSIANNFNTTLVFDGTAPILSSTNTLSGGTAQGAGNAIAFNANAAGYTLSGSAINLNGNITSSSTGSTIVLNLGIALVGSGTRQFNQNGNGGNLTVNSVISGSGAVSAAQGSGVTTNITFTGQSTFTGRLIVTRNVTFTSIANAGVPSAAGAGSIMNLGISGADGAFVYTGPAASSDKQIEIGNSGTTATNGGSILSNGSGGLIFTNPIFNVAPGAGITAQRTFTLGGTSAQFNEVRGVIQDNNTAGGGLVRLTVGSSAAPGLVWKLSGANTYTGTTQIAQGVVLEATTLANGGASSAIGSSSNAAGNLVFGNSGGILRYVGNDNVTTDRGFTTISTSGTAAVESSGAGTLTFTNTSGIAYSTTNQLRRLGLGGTNTGTNTFATNIGNNGTSAVSFTKTGVGRWILTGSNSYTSTTAIEGGVLVLGSDNALPGGIAASGGLSNLTLNGGVLGLAASGTFARGQGTGGTQVQITGGGGFAAYGANRVVNLGGVSGTLTWGVGNFISLGSGTGTFVLGAGSADAMVDFQNPIALGGTAGTTRTIRVDNGSAAIDARLSGIVSGSANVSKIGAGTLQFTSVNTYSGTTTIGGGRLWVDASGNLSNTARVVISGSDAELKWNSSTTFNRPLTFTQGTISGTGTIGVAVTAATGDVLSPGNSPGRQSYLAGLTLSPGGTYVWEVNSGTGVAGTNWDVIGVTGGALNLSGLTSGSTFLLNLTTLLASGSIGPMDNYVDGQTYSWKIFDAASLTLPGSYSPITSGVYAPGTDVTQLFTFVTTNWLNTVPEAQNMSVKVAADGTGLEFVIVPEPTAIALAFVGIGLAGIAVSRRRHRRD